MSLDRDGLLAEMNGRCAYCGRDLTTEEKWHADHVVPRIQGGGTKGNLVPACVSCNRRKGGRDPDSFRQYTKQRATKRLVQYINDEVLWLLPLYDPDTQRVIRETLDTLYAAYAGPIEFYMDTVNLDGDDDTTQQGSDR